LSHWRWMVMTVAVVSMLTACAPPVPALPPATVTPLPPTATPTASLESRAVDTDTPVPQLPDRTPFPTRLPTSRPATDTPSPTAPPATPTPTAVTPSPTRFDPQSVNLALEPLVTGLDSPVYLTHAGDGSGRLFVVERPGTVRLLAAGTLLPAPFLDLRDRVGSGGLEQGLLSLAFHPNYPANGRFFVYYTGLLGQTVVSRFQVSDDPNRADPASETVLLTVDQPAQNHNGGLIVFGPDGYLYVGLGDGGAANDRFGNGQNLGSLLGALLRLEVDVGQPYGVPADNPFWGVAGARPEIWAYGLRNPWRFSFDRATGDLYVADVGQNQYEEVNIQPAGSAGGQNYGWPIMEGFHCFQSADCAAAGLTLPLAEYDHNQGCSITGGYVYCGVAYPSLTGAYFYGDYCSGRIWALSRQASGNWENVEMLQTGLNISSFGQDERGELYVLHLNGGAVYQLVDRMLP